MADDTRRLTRRERYALTTQQAIVAAARKLFAERGYFATKVDDIAAEVEVAPATVYASTGGKQGLLAEMIRLWVADPAIESNLVRSRLVSDPGTIIADLAATTRHMREQWADVIRILLTTAPHDAGVAEQLEPGTQFYRDCLATIAQRLDELGALRDGIDVPYAADVLWFYFGYGSFFTLHEENGWSYARAEQWVTDHANRELLRSS